MQPGYRHPSAQGTVIPSIPTWTSGINSPKTWLTHHHILPWVWGACPCMHLCSYAKHADAVPEKTFQFWSHLTRAPCSSHVIDIWQTPSAFFCVLWSEKAFFWQPFQWGCGYGGGVCWCFLKPGDPTMPPRRHPWRFCCFSHHSPQYPGGQDAVVSSTHEVFNNHH